MEKELNEERTQIKRKYGEYSHIKVNEKAPIRNKVIEFVGKRFVTEEEMKNFLTQLTEERGKEFDQRKWFGNNEKYFESFENRGQKVWTLSKFGKRVLEYVIKKSAQKQQVNESVGLFKFSVINESSSDSPSYWKDYETDHPMQEESGKKKETDIKKIDKLIDDRIENWQEVSDEGDVINDLWTMRVKGEAYRFYTAFKYINANIIDAMIMQLG